MIFEVVTLFPELIESFRSVGVLGRAVDGGLVQVSAHDLRSWADNRWRQVDDEPYGGGAGMVLQAPPVLAAIRQLAAREPAPRVLLMSPRGRPLDQDLVAELATARRLVLLCGRYEGFDERVVECSPAEEVSIGDYVLGGGEVAAMAVIEAVARLVPGVVGDPASVTEDSFFRGLLDAPAYTRPLAVEGIEVPAVLRSGDHGAVDRWRLERAVTATVTRRPDLIKKNWQRYPDEVRALVRKIAPTLAAQAASRDETFEEAT